MDAAIDETATSRLRRDPSDKRPADRTNSPWILRSSDSGHWREHVPRQYNLRSRTDSNGSPEPSNPAPPIDLNADYPPSPSPPWYPGSPSRSPTHDAPPPDGSHQIASSPDKSHFLSTDTDSYSTYLPQHHVISPASSPSSSPEPLNPNTRFKSLSELMSIPTHGAPSPDGSPQIAPLPPASSPGSSQDRVPSPLNLGDDLPSDNHPLPTSPSNPGPSMEPNPPPSAKRPRPEEPETLKGHLDRIKMFKGKVKEHVPSPPNLGDDLPSDNHPLSTNPGPSIEPNPPPSTKRPRTKRPRPEEPETWRSFLNTQDHVTGPSTERNPPPNANRPRPDWRSTLRKMFNGKL